MILNTTVHPPVCEDMLRTCTAGNWLTSYTSKALNVKERGRERDRERHDPLNTWHTIGAKSAYR